MLTAQPYQAQRGFCQPDHQEEAWRRSVVVRCEWAQLRRALAHGEVTIEEILEHPAAQRRSLLVIVGHALRDRQAGAHPTPNARLAGPLLRRLVLSPSLTVGALSPARRHQLADEINRSRHYQRTQATARAGTAG